MSTHTQDYVYVTYIRTTPEKLWSALITPEFTKQYWFGIEVTSDWKVGSAVTYMKDGKSKMNGEVLVYEKPHTLSYTFHGTDDEMKVEPPTKVVLQLEQQPNSDVVKLTVTHSDFIANSKHRPSISHGWPMVLSGLKTFLETNAELNVLGCGHK